MIEDLYVQMRWGGSVDAPDRAALEAALAELAPGCVGGGRYRLDARLLDWLN